MTTDDLLHRVYADLSENRVFWTAHEVCVNGLNPAQRLLCLLQPQLLTQRTVVTLAPDEVFLDLRVEAPRAWRVLRVALGDHTVTPPVAGVRSGDLRKTSLEALRGQRDWFTKRKAYPDAWYMHGLWWVCLYPRATQAVTMTLVSSALPQPLRVEDPDREPEIPASHHALIAELAIPLLLAKEGAGAELEHAVTRLEGVLGAEPLKKLQRQLLAEKRYQMYAQAKVVA